jgi:hypothetical protein
MIARNCAQEDLSCALEKVNEKYEGNILFRDIAPVNAKRTRWRFTLTVWQTSRGKGRKKVSAPGVRRSHEGRRIAAACWHVHGRFFEALFEVNPKAEVVTNWRGGTRKITAQGGNWQDAQIGSMFRPMMFSEACDCERGRPIQDKTLGEGRAKSISRAELSAECWFIQIWGASYCARCEFKDTEDCGGKEIRKTMKNEKGFEVPLRDRAEG